MKKLTKGQPGRRCVDGYSRANGCHAPVWQHLQDIVVVYYMGLLTRSVANSLAVVPQESVRFDGARTKKEPTTARLR